MNTPLSGCAASPAFAVLRTAGRGTTPVAGQSPFHGVRWPGLLRGHRTGQAVRGPCNARGAWRHGKSPLNFSRNTMRLADHVVEKLLALV